LFNNEDEDLTVRKFIIPIFLLGGSMLYRKSKKRLNVPIRLQSPKLYYKGATAVNF